MDSLKFRAGEKFESLHVAAITAAGNSRSRIQDILNQTLEGIKKIREAFQDVWQNELIIEGRVRVAEWTREAVRRVREGAPPLSPLVLYEELRTLFKDRVWRRSVMLFVCGACVGGVAGLALGLRAAGGPAVGPHARALTATHDQAVVLVDDAITHGAGPGEVLVRVQAFSVSAADRAALRGHGATLRWLLGKTTVIVGRGFAGVILDVGPGVDELELGDEVWGCVSEWEGGAASELLVVRSTRVSKRPIGVGADCAAALPWGGSLCLRGLSSCGFERKSRRVCVAGAGSAEGCGAVQAARAAGAHVTALTTHNNRQLLLDLGANEVIVMEQNGQTTCSWSVAEKAAASRGPWDCVIVCSGPGCPPNGPPNPRALLRASANRKSIVDLRPKTWLSDQLPMPFSVLFATAFCTFRVLRWLGGCGRHTDWLEDEYRMHAGLVQLAARVDAGELTPVLDKVFLPQDFEAALSHACSDDAFGATVIRFP